MVAHGRPQGAPHRARVPPEGTPSGIELVHERPGFLQRARVAGLPVFAQGAVLRVRRREHAADGGEYVQFTTFTEAYDAIATGCSTAISVWAHAGDATSDWDT